MEAGESVAEACIREVLEETGLKVEITRLIGIYSNPNRVTEYADGNRYHIVGLCFEAVPVGGRLCLSDETTEFGYFGAKEIIDLPMMDHHRERISDVLTSAIKTFIR